LKTHIILTKHEILRLRGFRFYFFIGRNHPNHVIGILTEFKGGGIKVFGISVRLVVYSINFIIIWRRREPHFKKWWKRTLTATPLIAADTSKNF